MKIDIIDDKTIKVILSKIEMVGFNLSYEELDYKNPNTKIFLLNLVSRIKKDTSISFTSNKMFVEAFPYCDGGCILYLNLIESIKKEEKQSKLKASFDTPLIYKFKEMNHLLSICKILNQSYNHIILSNSLYKLNEYYYLLIYTYFKMDTKLKLLMNEYGTYSAKGAIGASMIKEHCAELIPSNAILELSKMS